AARPARAVRADVGFDRDRERGADRFAQLAGDAAFLAVRVTAQRVQPPETRRFRRLLFRVVDGDLANEKVLQGHAEPVDELRHQERLQRIKHFVSYAAVDQGPMPTAAMTPSTAIHTIVTGMNTFQPRRMIWSYR